MKYPSVEEVIKRWEKYFGYSGPKVKPFEIVKGQVYCNKKYKELYLDNRN